MMRAVSSSEPLTKRRPSGSSAREVTERVWCLKVRRTAPSSTLKSLTVPARAARKGSFAGILAARGGGGGDGASPGRDGGVGARGRRGAEEEAWEEGSPLIDTNSDAYATLTYLLD